MKIETDEPVFSVPAGEGKFHTPYGLFGGKDGWPHRYRIFRAADGSVRELKTKEVGVIIHPGDTLLAESAGGGGFGDPAKRDLGARAADIADGLVSP